MLLPQLVPRCCDSPLSAREPFPDASDATRRKQTSRQGREQHLLFSIFCVTLKYPRRKSKHPTRVLRPQVSVDVAATSRRFTCSGRTQKPSTACHNVACEAEYRFEHRCTGTEPDFPQGDLKLSGTESNVASPGYGCQAGRSSANNLSLVNTYELSRRALAITIAERGVMLLKDTSRRRSVSFDLRDCAICL